MSYESAADEFDQRWEKLQPCLPWGFRWMTPIVKHFAAYFFDCGYCFARNEEKRRIQEKEMSDTLRR